jgi:hypothetical protein
MNVADDLTQVISAEEVNGRWLNGPVFIQLPEEQWPMETGIADRKEIDKEKRQVKIVCSVAVSKPLFDCKRFSKWKRVIRITSYIKRFIQNCRNKCGRNERNQQQEVGPLTSQELENAEEYWLKQMQSNILKRLPRGDFETLSLYMDDRNILRVGGRVDPTHRNNRHRMRAPIFSQ